MDGELTNQDARKIIETLKKEDDLQNDWETYHLIGDILRQPETLPANITQRVKQKLESEPILLKPNKVAKVALGNSKIKVFTFAAAASIFAMVAAWLVMHDVNQQPYPPMIAEKSQGQSETDRSVTSATMLVSHPQSSHSYQSIPIEDMDNYLFFHNFHNFHNDFPSEVAAHGQPVYIYPVTDFHDTYGR